VLSILLRIACRTAVISLSTTSNNAILMAGPFHSAYEEGD
jgi:hypothetical protein